MDCRTIAPVCESIDTPISFASNSRRRDSIRFALKKDYSDRNPVILKTVDVEDLLLKLLPSDTKRLPYGDYVYDVELTQEDGTVDTFIARARLRITEEVY